MMKSDAVARAADVILCTKTSFGQSFPAACRADAIPEHQLPPSACSDRIDPAVGTENLGRLICLTSAAMAALIFFLLNLVASLFKSKSRLEAENANRTAHDWRSVRSRTSKS